MNKREAHELLDALRAGLPVDDAAIDEALWMTGDLRPAKPKAPPPVDVLTVSPWVAAAYGELERALA